MNYRRLGRTNIDVSVVGVGTCQLRLVPERHAIETLGRAFRRGINIVHTAPDYEGVENLIVRAIEMSGVTNKINVCSMSWGDADQMERVLDSTCKKLGRDTLDLYGIAAVSDRETFGENVWGKGGMVEFLQKKKEEGRIGGIYCSIHGSPSYIKQLIERDAFDAIMIPYNVLGFHLLTCPSHNYWKYGWPPDLAAVGKGKWEFEDIPHTRDEVFPIVKERDIGLMIMKPLAGGLLCPSKAFPRRAELMDATSFQPTAKDLLRHILMNPEVSCVLPGTASIEEAEENADAGSGDITLTNEKIDRIDSFARKLNSSYCSRCGECDALCSKGLPISWIFRAAYINIFPSATFETYDEIQYYALHPQIESICSGCREVTCGCPHGIDIRSNLMSLNELMKGLRSKGFVQAEPTSSICNVDRPYDMRLIIAEIQDTMRAGETAVIRLLIQNTGRMPWFRSKNEGTSDVVLSVCLDGVLVQKVGLRDDVNPGEKTHFVFEINVPDDIGIHRIKMDVMDVDGTLFSSHGVKIVHKEIKVV